MWMHSNNLDPSAWPLLPRPEVFEDVVAALLSSPIRSHLLRGASGIGKSTIAAQVSAKLIAGGRRVVPIVALAELREVPLAALAPVLGARAVEGENLDERVQALVRLLGSGPEDYVMVVDDAPLLDDLSASIVYQLVRVFGLPVLLTARDEHEITGPIGRLLHENLVTIIDVGPLDTRQVASIVESHLHDHVRPESVNALHASSEGNPLLLRELVFAEQRAGRVHQGKFGLELETSELPAQMLETVRERIAAIHPHDRRLVELLALSQPWSEAVIRSVDSDALKRLIRMGIVSLDERSDRRQTRLAHPLFAEALRAGIEESQLAQTLREAAQLLMLTEDDSDRFTAMCLIVDHPDTAQADLEWAAERALTAGDPSVARRLAMAAGRGKPRFGASLIAATACSALGVIEQAEAAFVAAEGLAHAGHERALLALRWGQHLAYRQQNPAAAVERTVSALGNIPAGDASILGSEIAKWRLMAGDTTALGVPSNTAAEGGPLGALAAGLGQAMFSTMLGDGATASAAISEVRPHLDSVRTQLPHAESLLDLSEFLIDVAEGKTNNARLFAENQRVVGSADSAGIWSYTLALIHGHAGRHDLAAPLAELAIRQLEWRDFSGLLGSAIALSAAVFALNGETQRGRETRLLLGEVAEKDVKVALHLAEYGVWIAATPEEREGAVATLADVVDTALEQGHHLLAALSATVAIRVGSAVSVVELLERAARESPSELVDVVAGVARSLVDRDAGSVMMHIPRLRAAGLVAVARCAVEDIRTVSGSTELVRRQALALSAELAGVTLADPTSFSKAVELDGIAITEREWRVAVAAARRERSSEIAESLGISVRTVDNHLASVYRKLGISNRRDLAAIVNPLGLEESDQSGVTRSTDRGVATGSE